MRKILIIVGFVLVACAGWIGFNRSNLPPIPKITAEITKPVNLEYRINKINSKGVELQLLEEDFYFMFLTSSSWKRGTPGLILQSIRSSSNFPEGMRSDEYIKNQETSGQNNLSDFMKDSKGREIKTYTFEYAIGEGEKGELYMRISHKGPRMKMIQLLEFREPIEVPSYIAHKFEVEQITMQPSTCRFDKKMNGFWIPIETK